MEVERVAPYDICHPHAIELDAPNSTVALTDDHGVPAKSREKRITAGRAFEAVCGFDALVVGRVRGLALLVTLDFDVAGEQAHLTLVLAMARVVVVAERAGQREPAVPLAVDPRVERFDTRATESFESLNDQNSVKILSKLEKFCQNS